MAEDYKKPEKIVPLRLGEYLTCSRGSIVMAIKNKLESLERGNNNSGLGEFLVELGIITEEELQNALRRQRADGIGLCHVFSSRCQAPANKTLGLSVSITISEIPGGSMNVRVDFTLICDSNGLDYGFDRVMNFDSSKTVIVGKPDRDPDDSSPCGCNCYDVIVSE